MIKFFLALLFTFLFFSCASSPKENEESVLHSETEITAEENQLQEQEIEKTQEQNPEISNEEIREAMHIVGLDPDSKKHVGKYSLGMRQRLGIAQAIMEDPDMLLLDEPLNGLDNEGVEEIRKVLLSLKEKGKLIILASHSKEDIQILCDTVFRMDHGKIIATETN